MKTNFLVPLIAILLSPALVAQTDPKMSAFQQPGWIAVPNSDPVWIASDRPLGQWGPILDRPFAAREVRRTVQTLADGTQVQKESLSAFFRDNLGRMRSESQNTFWILIYDPVAGFTYNLDTRTKRYSKRPVSDKASSRIVAFNGGTSELSIGQSGSGLPGARTENLPPQMIDGLKATGTRVTVMIPAGAFGNDHELTVVNERWYSDDLKALVKSSNSDPRFGTTTYELTNIVQAPPDPALFQVPVEYTIK
jgi:hypothetical protein